MSTTLTATSVSGILLDGQPCPAYNVSNLWSEQPAGMLVVIPQAAIANRKIVYNVSTDQEAITKIILEHYDRLNRPRLADGTPDPSWTMPADLTVTLA